MLPVASKYRIAKRLGPAVFDQTQTQKFALRMAQAADTKKRGRGGRGGRGGSDYGRQLLEKQRIRFTYGLSEGQLSGYAQKAFTTENPSLSLHRALESRADSVVYRAGFASTRRAARQAVSHGHILINGVRTTIPSHHLKKGDVLSVRDGSRKSPLFAVLAEKNPEGRSAPSWIEVDEKLLTIKVSGDVPYSREEGSLDYATLFEFYSR